MVGLWGGYILKPQTELYPYLPKPKVAAHILDGFSPYKAKWFSRIEQSFIPEEMQKAYKTLITERLLTLTM